FDHERSLSMVGACTRVRASSVHGSDANTDYDNLMTTLVQWQKELQIENGKFAQLAMQNPQAAEVIKKTMAEIDRKQMHLLDSLKKEDPFLARIAALNTYLSFPNNQG